MELAGERWVKCLIIYLVMLMGGLIRPLVSPLSSADPSEPTRSNRDVA